MERVEAADVVIVGGGLGGLISACYLARTGRQVLLLERTETLGGRAQTKVENEFLFNQGAHVFFLGGPLQQVMHELGIEVNGGHASPRGVALYRGRMTTLPTDLGSFLTTGLLSIPAKLELLRISLPKLRPKEWMDKTVRQWIEQSVWQTESRLYLHSMVRLATFANDPDNQSAGAAIAQLQRSQAMGDLYLDGGWQSLVDPLVSLARGTGVEIRTGVRVDEVEREGKHWTVKTGPDEGIEATAVILAVSPRAASAMVLGEAGKVLAKIASSCIPVVASTLAVGLARLPDPIHTFAAGIDAPTYLSVHSRYAKLGPPGAAVIELVKFLNPNALDTGPGAEKELESVLDRVQPGWRDLVEARQWLPRVVVSNALVTARGGGYEGRRGPQVAGAERFYVVGDWIGPEMLGNAVAWSAKRAAEMMLERSD